MGDDNLNIKPMAAAHELDKSLLVLQPDEEAFFKAETGITDLEKLKEHIYAVQEEAYRVVPFPCIRLFAFTRLKISRFPIYKHVLELGSNRSDAIFLDIGCCFGNDSRKVIRDEFPAENVIASDIQQEFWDLGHKLFNSTPESFPVKFIAGDAFDPSILALLEDKTSVTSSIPPLQSLTSLNPLRGHVSAIHASSFFHLFGEDRQLKLAYLFAGLLDQRPGSIIFGSHGGMPKKGFLTNVFDRSMFCHSPESWMEMWENEVFERGAVKVTAHLHAVQGPHSESRGCPEKHFNLLVWSVVRL